MAHSNQGGVKNYLGNQKMVKAPLHWQSAPNHPTTELAYITQKEKDLLVKKDLHGSLKGGVNRGPSGIMSLNGWGSADAGQNVSGAAASAAETGSGNARDRAEVRANFTPAGSPALPPGVTPKGALDFRAAAINAGAGQRVNPGFFDSRTRLSPNAIALARAYRTDPNNLFAKQAYRNTGQGGLRGFIGGGGFFGNLLRGVGQKFGWGKKYNEPTQDMSQFSNYGLGGVPYGTLDEDDDEKISETSFSPRFQNTNITGGTNVNDFQGVNFNDQIQGTDNISDLIASQKQNIEYPSFQDGGRAGYQGGELVDEDINIQGPGFDVNENMEMAEKTPFEMRIDELMDTGMSWQEAYDIASDEFNQLAEGGGESFSEEGIASIV